MDEACHLNVFEEHSCDGLSCVEKRSLPNSIPTSHSPLELAISGSTLTRFLRSRRKHAFPVPHKAWQGNLSLVVLALSLVRRRGASSSEPASLKSLLSGVISRAAAADNKVSTISEDVHTKSTESRHCRLGDC